MNTPPSANEPAAPFSASTATGGETIEPGGGSGGNGKVDGDGKAPGDGWGASLVGGWIIPLLVIVILLAALSLYGLWVFWPSESVNTTGGANPLPLRKTVHFFTLDRVLSRESLFFVTVAFAGALGGMVHSMRSLAVYVGSRELRWSWVPFYFLKPVLGAALATLLYFVLRAGLFSPSVSSQEASPYGFAAIGALAGLFSDQASEKLRKVAEEVFDKLPPGKDSVAALPMVKAGAARGTGPNEATVSGTVNPRGLETSVWLEYGKPPAYDQQSPPASQGAGLVDRHVEVRLAGLDPDTSYHGRVVATSSAGTSRGEEQQFKTDPLPAGGE